MSWLPTVQERSVYLSTVPNANDKHQDGTIYAAGDDAEIAHPVPPELA
ncbi:MAG: hypothetical protein OXN89_03170 [Bryobacterales bacterium]|nr:hypothetical protein [Bryobacterales bacterium]